MSYNYNGIANVTGGTSGTDYIIDSSGMLYILTSNPKLTFNTDISLAGYYENGAYPPAYGSIVGFVVLVGAGGSGYSASKYGGGGGGGGVYIQNNFPFLNTGNYTFQVGTYKSGSNGGDTILKFNKSTTSLSMYTAGGGKASTSTTGGASGTNSIATTTVRDKKTTIFPGLTLPSGTGGQGSTNANSNPGTNGANIGSLVPLNIYCGGGGGGGNSSGSSVGGDGGLGGGGGGGGSSGQGITFSGYGGGGGGNSGGLGKNGVIIIYATCYNYSLKYNVIPSSITGYTLNSNTQIESLFEPFSGNSAQATSYKHLKF